MSPYTPLLMLIPSHTHTHTYTGELVRWSFGKTNQETAKKGLRDAWTPAIIIIIRVVIGAFSLQASRGRSRSNRAVAGPRRTPGSRPAGSRPTPRHAPCLWVTSTPGSDNKKEEGQWGWGWCVVSSRLCGAAASAGRPPTPPTPAVLWERLRLVLWGLWWGRRGRRESADSGLGPAGLFFFNGWQTLRCDG